MAHTFATRESILSVSIVLIPAQVAIKLFRKPRDSEKATPAHHEIFIFQDVKRQHIVRLHELVETSCHLGLVLTYYSEGNLVTYIFTHNHVEEQLASRMSAQLVSALGYLHEKGKVHGSILIENLLLDDNENLFISSLALVRKYGPRTETGGSYYRSKLGYSITRDSTILDIGLHKRFNGRYQLANSLYAAPELTAHELPHLMGKMDVWSCGVILVRFSSRNASPIDY
jgi:serine/threonine protein kinase